MTEIATTPPDRREGERAAATRAGIQRLLRSTVGTTAIEFALVAMPFLLMIFGIMEVSRVIWTQSSLQFAVERAARCAAVNQTLCPGTSSQIRAYVLTQLHAPVSALTVSYSATGSCGAQVQASATFAFVVDIFSPSLLTLTAQACHPT